jgi:hypothetical protein
VVKEHLDPQAVGAVLLVNLVAADPEEADWLAYHLVSTALTAAREGVATALAAYDQQEMALATASLHPRESLKRALKLSERVTILARHDRLLALPNLPRLRRRVRILGGDGIDGGGAGFGKMVQLELEALEQLARDHPLTVALPRVWRGSPPPATVTVISQWNHDAEALAVVLPRLRGQGYAVLDLLAERR